MGYKGRLFCALALRCIGLFSIFEVPFVWFFFSFLKGISYPSFIPFNPYLIYYHVVSHPKKNCLFYDC